jgi:hypothetical protein
VRKEGTKNITMDSSHGDCSRKIATDRPLAPRRLRCKACTQN